VSRKQIFVLAAFALLFAAGTDLLVVDLFAPLLCDDSQASGRNEDCFCCCAHIIVAAPPIQIPAQPVQFTDVAASPVFFSQEPTDVYHPPRA
jgi:hypothetical protein